MLLHDLCTSYHGIQVVERGSAATAIALHILRDTRKKFNRLPILNVTRTLHVIPTPRLLIHIIIAS